MNNPFEVILQRLDKIEEMLSTLRSAVSNRCEQEPKAPIGLVKIEHAVQITGYKKGYIYELVHRGAIPHIKRGRSVRFDTSELEAWMRAARPDVVQETIRRLKP